MVCAPDDPQLGALKARLATMSAGSRTTIFMFDTEQVSGAQPFEQWPAEKRAAYPNAPARADLKGPFITHMQISPQYGPPLVVDVRGSFQEDGTAPGAKRIAMAEPLRHFFERSRLVHWGTGDIQALERTFGKIP